MIKKSKIEIWERTLLLEVLYNHYTNEKVTSEQKKAYKWFRKHPEWIDKAKTYVEDYCKNAVNSDDSNQKKDNVFSYVKPKAILIKQDTRIAIMCDYRYDEEHGLAIVFDHDGNITVGMQDIIL